MLKTYGRGPMLRLIILVMFVSCLAFAGLRQRNTNSATVGNSPPSRFSAALYRQKNAQGNSAAKAEEATPVTEGVMSERERKHSKEYEKEYQWRKARKLKDIKGTAEVQVTIETPFIPDDPDVPPLTASDFSRKMSCQADAIVIGTIQNKHSQLTEDGSFTFSQHGMHVDEILKNNSASPIALNSIIDITRPGGAIQLNTRVFRVTDSSFPRLEVNTQYLIFLKFNPATDSYRAFIQGGDYELVGDRFSPLVAENLPAELRGGNRSSLITLLRHAVTMGCN